MLIFGHRARALEDWHSLGRAATGERCVLNENDDANASISADRFSLVYLEEFDTFLEILELALNSLFTEIANRTIDFLALLPSAAHFFISFLFASLSNLERAVRSNYAKHIPVPFFWPTS